MGRRALLGLGLALGGMAGAGFADNWVDILRFNTVCAYCHEGECSGRLSFALGPEAGFSHIRRYAGPVDDAFVRRLYDALVHMKQECAYLSPPPLAPGSARREELDRYRDPANGQYFLPLGLLDSGHHRLRLGLAEPSSFRVEIIDAYFDLVVDRCVGPGVSELTVDFSADQPSRYYLRLRAPQPLRLIDLGREDPPSRR